MSNTKPVQRGNMTMLTLDPQRLGRAGSVQRVSFTGRLTNRRRATQRAAVLLLLGGLVLLGAIVLIALSGAGLRDAHAQTIGEPVCYVSAPTLPQSNPLNCLQPRAFMPAVMNAH